jgi:hypothetical protein
LNPVPNSRVRNKAMTLLVLSGILVCLVLLVIRESKPALTPSPANMVEIAEASAAEEVPAPPVPLLFRWNDPVAEPQQPARERNAWSGIQNRKSASFASKTERRFHSRKRNFKVRDYRSAPVDPLFLPRDVLRGKRRWLPVQR